MDNAPPVIRHAYVHVPFCTRRCSYCDFAISIRRNVPAEAYVRAIVAEVAVRHSGDNAGNLDTLYLGGGTPSRLGTDGISALINGLAAAGLPSSDGSEVTMEANPEDVNQASVAAWLAAGINRLSIGIQSFSPDALAWMHRTHDAAQASRAVRSARQAGMAHV